MLKKIASFLKLDSLKKDEQLNKSQNLKSKGLEKSNSVFSKTSNNFKLDKLNKEEAQKLLLEKQEQLKEMNAKLEKLKNAHYAEKKEKRNKAIKVTGAITGSVGLVGALLLGGSHLVKTASAVALGAKVMPALLTGAALVPGALLVGAGLAIGGMFLAKKIGDYSAKKSENNNKMIQDLNKDINKTQIIINNLKTYIAEGKDNSKIA